MSVVSSITIIAADPSIDPARIRPSKLACTSRLSGVSTGVDEPPGMMALSAFPSGTPPA